MVPSTKAGAPPSSTADEDEAAAALAAVSGSAVPLAGAPAPSSATGGDLPLCSGEDEIEDCRDPQMQRRNSGSLSTHDRSDWRGGSQPLGGQSPLLPSSLGALAQSQRGRRNARQQEQNKQAQQRYRAKRKAQFEELQAQVHHLSADAADARRLRQENERLRAEVARLRTMAGPPATSAAGAASQPLPLSLPDTLGPSPLPLPLPASGMSASPAKRTASGAFKPTAAARPLALSTLGGLPMPSAPAALVPAAAPLKPAAVPAKQLQAALQLYYRDLQAFATQQQLDRMPADGTGLAPDVVLHLSALVHTGAELAKLILQVSGPDATSLLTADMPAAGSDGASPADSLAQWRAVAARVELSPEQRAALADWRRRFLARLDDIYGRRLLHKAALAQAPPAPAAPGQQPQWMEALLLQAAEQSGFSACALACAQLDGQAQALLANAGEERAVACELVGELLCSLLTKVQAARYLLAGHPFFWNGLSFANAVASTPQQLPALAPPAAAPQQQQQQQPGLAASLPEALLSLVAAAKKQPLPGLQQQQQQQSAQQQQPLPSPMQAPQPQPQEQEPQASPPAQPFPAALQSLAAAVKQEPALVSQEAPK